jgi:hypothetical protein
MGYVRPTAIVVSAGYEHDNGRHWIETAHETAFGIFSEHGLSQLVSNVVDAQLNNEFSFFIAWDGSKEGWPDSDAGDEARADFINWLRDQLYEDGSGPLNWIEIQYGGDDNDAIVLAHKGDMVRR